MESFELELTEENIKETILKNYLDNNKRLYTLARLIDSIENNTTYALMEIGDVERHFLLINLYI